MYSMRTERIPSKPVISTASQVDRQLSIWLKENDLKHIEDSDGLVWNMSVTVIEKPDENDLHSALWRLTFDLKVDVPVESFIKTNVLDEMDDARLIELIGDRLVPLRMKPSFRTAQDAEHARILLAETTIDMRKRLRSLPLREVKRSLIARFVDGLGRFGASS